MTENGETRKKPKSSRKRLEPSLPTTTDAAPNRNAKATKLVAVPRITNLKPNTPLTTTSSSHSNSRGSKESTPLSMPARSAARPDAKESEEGQDCVKWEYDVYAKPFVPSALRAVNGEYGHVVNTDTKHKIDSLAYIDKFVGRSFVPERVDVSIQQASQQTPDPLPVHILAEESYLQYFLALWKIEWTAKERENDDHALYKVPLSLSITPDGQQLYSLSIPGLREDSPLVEMGDTLQLRRLWIDSFGNQIALPTQMSDPAYYAPVLRTWGGTQYNASVYSVNRAQETVYLKITGFTPSHPAMGVRGLDRPNPPNMVFNVVFPLKQRPLQVLWRALVFVDNELKKICRGSDVPNTPKNAHEELSRQAASRPHTNSANVNGETPGASGLEEQTPNDWIRRMLFPTEADGTTQTKLRTIPFRRGMFDHDHNYEQLQSVDSVCGNGYGVVPYLISGPPGTGKTKTLKELALNLLNTTDIAHILICAPSDQAADTLALRLKQHLTTKQLFRLNGPSRADIEVPGGLMPYCYMEHEMFYLPPFAQLMAFNVVVTSTRDAAILADVRLTNTDLYTIEKNMLSAFHPETSSPPPSLHWGALLLDEAAQATELDILPALSVVMPPSSYPKTLPQPRFAMAGDQNQLGPRTASRDALFSTSLLERLFERPLYKHHPLSRPNTRPSASPPVMTKKMLPMLSPPFTNLIRNYRSHPAILSVPSTLFYNDTLLPEASIPTSPLQTSPLWQGQKWPVLFVPQLGADEIERDGGGWYNVSECRVACDLAQRLVYSCQVAQKDICIMSPFAAQVKRLRGMIRGSTYGHGSGLWDVNIGPLEAFQGLESRVVIICTTRTRDRFLEADSRRGLGIVHQARKMNVALTRAKEALFVIGSPKVLMQDRDWRAFLAFCWRNRLVQQNGVRWDGDKEDFGHVRVGVLERALLVKEERKAAHSGRILGAGHAAQGFAGEDEMWTAGLNAALEESADDDGEAEYDDHDEDDPDEKDADPDSSSDNS